MLPTTNGNKSRVAVQKKSIFCSDNPCFSKAPQVHIGTGEYEWQEIEDDSLMMIHGPQGGWHMLGSIWLAIQLKIVEVSFQIFTLDDVMISDNNYRVAMIMEEECVGYYWNVWIFKCWRIGRW